jgi:glutathione S-transferase
VRRKTGLRVVSIEEVAAPHLGSWRQWLVDGRMTPADTACFQIDFEVWLAGLPARKRQMAELLAEGHETGCVAKLLSVTPAAVSISRTWLEASWCSFQGELGTAAPSVRRGRGRPRKARRETRDGMRLRVRAS